MLASRYAIDPINELVATPLEYYTFFDANMAARTRYGLGTEATVEWTAAINRYVDLIETRM